jgi:carboxypeptidase PM20D1
MRRGFIGLGAVILLLLLVATVRTLTLSPPTLSRDAAITPVPPVAALDVAQHLARLVRFKTVSYGGGLHEEDKNAELDAMRGWMEATYPHFHGATAREMIGRSLLFTWKGADPRLPPILLMAHMDVVPVVPGTDTLWQHDPFSGDIAGGYVWGRGSIDDKGSLVCILEAAERLAAVGFTPARTILFSFGQDEEVGGSNGTAQVARALAARGVHLSFVLDEGGSIQLEPYPGVHRPTAVVAVAEKGYLSLELVAHGTGGHSSRPSNDLAIERLSKAIVAVVGHPFTSGLDDVQRRKLAVIAPYTPFATRFVLANLWLTAPVVTHQMNAVPDTAARLHTTISPTIVAGGVKDNVLPPVARAVINFRLHPRDSIAEVIAHVEHAIDDPKVDVVQMMETNNEASRISDMDGPGYKFIEREIRDTFDVPVAPDTTTGATDSRHYLPLADAVFRLDPFHLAPEDSARVHGTNERLAISDIVQGTQFYMRLMKDLR